MTAPLDPHSGSASAPQAALEATLESLLQSLLEVGICASDVQESALETSVGGAASGYPGGLLGRKVYVLTLPRAVHVVASTAALLTSWS